MEAKEILEKCGHTCVPFVPPGMPGAVLVTVVAVFLGDGGKAFKQYINRLELKTLWNSMGLKPVFDWWTDVGLMEDWRNDVIQAMKDQRIDVIISPGFASPALPLLITRDIISVDLYNLLYNGLNFPAGSLPVATVTKEDLDNLEENYKPRNKEEKNLKEGCRGGLGLPINVQCASMNYKEELVLRIMKDIENGVKRRKINC